MKYRNFGTAGFKVSEIGFGGWGIGGQLYGEISDKDAEDTLRRAFDRGVTLYDTSPAYGEGRSERLIGKAFKGDRDKVIIATKGGSDSAYGEQDFSAQKIKQSIDDSLQRLETDYIDIFQLHSPPLDQIRGNDALFCALEDAHRNGKIRGISLSARSPEDALSAVKEFDFASIQINFNLVDQRAHEMGLFDICEKENIALIIRTPLCFGFLSGDFDETTEFDRTVDHRGNWAPKQRAIWANSWLKFDEARKAEGITPVQFALRFCLDFPGVTTVIPGMMNIAQVDENALSSDLTSLQESSLRAAAKIYSNETFFLGRDALLRDNPATN